VDVSAAGSCLTVRLEPPVADPFIAQELAETGYHVLWELVHVFFEHRGLLEGRHERRVHDAGASSFLYPFLGEEEHDLEAVVADVRASVLMKSEEVGSLRERTLTEGLQLKPDGGAPGGGSGRGCFIVSAATGSAESEEVHRLRQLRDRIAGVSRFGADLIDVIYREYYQFSPAIAAEVEQDAFTQQAVLRIIVRPLLAWYTLAGTLAFEHRDEEAIQRAAREVLKSCPTNLGGSSLVALLDAIRSGEQLPGDTPQILRDFAPRIQEAASYSGASWAILDPLMRTWKSAIDQLDVIDQVSQWLANAPLESLPRPGTAEELDRELGVLTNFFCFRPDARLQLGARLTAAWPDMTSTLARHGFV